MQRQQRLYKLSTRLFVLLFVFFISQGLNYGKTTKGKTRVNLVKLQRYIEKARQDWKVPGLSVAIVKDGNVVLAQGFGLKEFSKAASVDKDTLFAIASNTKAFTSASVAMLVDESKLDWKDKVRKWLPYFKLYDPYVSEKITLEDLLCHRSGLGTFSGDLLWYETSYTTEEVIKRARFLKPRFGFRAGFGYSNIMFMAAGEVVAAVTGKPWKEFIKTRIFTPLHMKRTHIGTNALKKYDNVATPHYVYPDGKAVTVPYTNSDCSAGAAAINSSAADMAQWLKMLLAKGKAGDKVILSENALETMWTPYNSFRVSGYARTISPSTHFRGYGLGWSIYDYHGNKVMTHSGGLDGMISRVALVPEIGLGVVILTNSINGLPSPLTNKILDLFMGAKNKDWSQFYLDRAKKRAAEAAAPKEEKKKIPGAAKAGDLKEYTGTYGGDLYGDATVKLVDNKLVLNLVPAPIFISDLSYIQYDTFKVQLRNNFSFIPSGKGTLQFLRNSKGKIIEMKLDIPNRDFHFTELELKKK